jgi:transcriptional regulatory protein GAL4
MALGLGLHREFPEEMVKSETLAQERRRQVWWILYCFDSGFSITTGRPTTASDAVVDVRKPRNIDDSVRFSQRSHAALADVCQMFKLSSPVPLPVEYPTTYSAIIAQAHLAVIANRIYNDFLSAHATNAEIDSQVALQMEQLLDEWKRSLPPYFTNYNPPQWFCGPRAVVFWKEQNLRIMLWRGVGRQRSYANPTSSNRAEAAWKVQSVAMETVHEISAFCREHAELLHLGLSWYATYFLFQATLVLDLGLLQQESHNEGPAGFGEGMASAASVLSPCIFEARGAFSVLGLTNPAATRCISVLDRIHDHLVTASDTSGPYRRHHHQKAVTSDPFTLSSSAARDNGTSPIAQESVHNNILSHHWAWAADPALHTFLFDETAPMSNVFDGVEGFPSTQEQEYFDYVSGSLYETGGEHPMLRDLSALDFDVM